MLSRAPISKRSDNIFGIRRELLPNQYGAGSSYQLYDTPRRMPATQPIDVPAVVTPIAQSNGVAPAQNSIQRWQGTRVTGDGSIPGLDPSVTPTGSPVTPRFGGVKTAADVAQEARDLWGAEGGSQRTWNKAGVAAGIRPRMDARATQNPRNSTSASNDIRAGWGWKSDLPY